MKKITSESVIQYLKDRKENCEQDFKKAAEELVAKPELAGYHMEWSGKLFDLAGEVEACKAILYRLDCDNPTPQTMRDGYVVLQKDLLNMARDTGHNSTSPSANTIKEKILRNFAGLVDEMKWKLDYLEEN